MTAAVLTMIALSGNWYTPGSVVTPLRMNDINGVAITVGATVKIIGTVVAINPGSTHFDNISVQVANPSGIQNVPARPVLNVYPLNVAVGS